MGKAGSRVDHIDQKEFVNKSIQESKANANANANERNESRIAGNCKTCKQQISQRGKSWLVFFSLTLIQAVTSIHNMK